MNRLSQFTMDVAEPEDVDVLVREVRIEDADEIRLMGQSTVEDAIRMSAKHSNVVFAAKIDGELLCLFGVHQTSDSGATIWEIGTKAIRKHAKAFLQATPHMLALCLEVAKGVDTFTNYLPDSYSTYRKWLERHAGATFDEQAHPSQTGAIFRRFVIRRKGA